MSSTHFSIDKTTGSDNTTVKVTTTSANTTAANYAAKVKVSKGTDTDEASVTQYFRPMVMWYGTSATIPDISAIGGTLNMRVVSPYDFYIYDCPDNITNVYKGKQYNAGTHTIECRILESTSTSTKTQTIQIAFDRMDGRKSYTADPDGFKVQYKQAGAVQRRLQIAPAEWTYGSEGGKLNAVLRLVGRQTGENVIIDHNESIDYVELTKFQWRSNESEYADLEFTFQPNSGAERSGAYYSFETFSDALHISISLSQEASSPELRLDAFTTIDGQEYSLNSPSIPKNSKEYVLHLTNKDAIMGVSASASYVHLSSYDTGSDEIHFIIDENNTTQSRVFSISITGNQTDTITFSAIQLNKARSITTNPSSINAPATGGNYSVDVIIMGKYLEEAVSVESTSDYVQITDIEWDTPESNTGYMDIIVEPNTNANERGTTVTITGSDGISYTIPIIQEGTGEFEVWDIDYQLTNAVAHPHIDGVVDHSPLTLVISPSTGYELKSNAFHIVMNGDTITDDEGVLTNNGDGTWTIHIEDVYGRVLIWATGTLISNMLTISYDFIDGVTLFPMPTEISRGGTLTLTATVLDGYSAKSAPSVEVFLGDGSQILPSSIEYDSGRDWTIIIEDITDNITINVLAAALAIDLVGLRFNSSNCLEFYLNAAMNEDIEIALAITGEVPYNYIISAGDLSQSTTTNGKRLNVYIDFNKYMDNKQINSCAVIVGSGFLSEEMSEGFITAMKAVGNNSYTNIVWDE